jgi:hypothetical protein
VSVGDVLEVMTQVDHALTVVSKFDLQLRLIKNMGRHNHLGRHPPEKFPGPYVSHSRSSRAWTLLHQEGRATHWTEEGRLTRLRTRNRPVPRKKHHDYGQPR